MYQYLIDSEEITIDFINEISSNIDPRLKTIKIIKKILYSNAFFYISLILCIIVSFILSTNGNNETRTNNFKSRFIAIQMIILFIVNLPTIYRLHKIKFINLFLSFLVFSLDAAIFGVSYFGGLIGSLMNACLLYLILIKLFPGYVVKVPETATVFVPTSQGCIHFAFMNDNRKYILNLKDCDITLKGMRNGEFKIYRGRKKITMNDITINNIYK